MKYNTVLIDSNGKRKSNPRDKLLVKTTTPLEKGDKLAEEQCLSIKHKYSFKSPLTVIDITPSQHDDCDADLYVQYKPPLVGPGGSVERSWVHGPE